MNKAELARICDVTDLLSMRRAIGRAAWLRMLGVASVLCLAACTESSERLQEDEALALADGSMLIVSASTDTVEQPAAWVIEARRTKQRGLYPPIWATTLMTSPQNLRDHEVHALIAVSAAEVLIYLKDFDHAFRLDLSSGKVIRELNGSDARLAIDGKHPDERRVRAYGPQTFRTKEKPSGNVDPEN